MLKNITFSADKELIEKARARATAESTTLNEEFRRWLARYAERPLDAEAFVELMEQLDYVRPGRSFTREEMNAR
jgi:hypothetical protein